MPLYVICLSYLIYDYHSHTQYENERKKNADLLSDVHDCKAWEMRRRQVGADSDDLCIQLLFCMDAIPEFKNQGMSLMPAESIILNFPPQLRSKVDFMMLHFLIPSTLKEWKQKKIFRLYGKHRVEPFGNYRYSLRGLQSKSAYLCDTVRPTGT